MESTKLPLSAWLLTAYLFVTSISGITAKEISELTGVSYCSTKLMIRKIKQAQKENNDKHPIVNCAVSEVNTAYFGGKKPGKRGLGAEGTVAVATAVSKEFVEYE